MNINDLLQGPMRDILIGQVTQQIGIDNPNQANSAVSGVLSTLLGGLAKNASSEAGASSLLNALDRDHDGSIFDDVMGFLGGNSPLQNTKTANGAGILKHILGDNQNQAVDQISQSSGLDSAKVMQLMTSLAPIVMGFLGKAKNQQSINSGGGLMDLLGTLTSSSNQAPCNQSFIEKMIDKDGDGRIVDDVAGMGMKALFSKFFKK